MRSSDDYNTRQKANFAGNQDSGKAVALQPSASESEYDEVGLALKMQHSDNSTYPTKTINFIPQYPPSTNLIPSFKYTPETGKSLFTDSQWQEFESQKMIFKHIMASTTPLPPQSNRLRFSVGSDPEPWRCRRTDGKKWRCSRDVVPDQKYCERHAHKSRTRPRSRKLVELETLDQSHKTIHDDHHHNYHPTLATSSQQSRCTEWFIKTSGIIPLSTTSNQKIHKPMGSDSPSSTLGLGSSKRERDHFPRQLLEGTHHQDFVGVWSRNHGYDDCSPSLSNTHDFFQMENETSNEDKGGNVEGSNPWPNSWLGGPLGEALCPRITRTSNEPPNDASNDSGRGLC